MSPLIQIALGTLGSAAAVTVTLLAPPTAAPTPAVPSNDDGYASVDRYVGDRMGDLSIPGLAYAVVSPEGVEHVATFGHDGAGDAVTPRTPFLWGSVAKPVTAAAVMTLVESGDIDIDQPVSTYLPEFTLADRSASATITVRHLLQQTSGIPDGTGITDRYDIVDDPYTRAIAALAGIEPIAEPAAQHEYASANYLILGGLVEAVTGRPFADHLKLSVLDPLGMEAPITSATTAADLPAGHRYVFGRPVAYHGGYDATGPSYGYLGGSIEDLARFARMNLSGGTIDGSTVLDATTLNTMHTGAVEISATHHYGLGWRDDERNADLGTRTVWHSGAVNGFFASVVLLPGIDRAVVLAQNAHGPYQDDAVNSVALGAARMLAGGDAVALGVDSVYALALGGLVGGVLLLSLSLAGAANRLRHPRPGRGSARRQAARRGVTTAGWLAGSAAVAYAAAVAIPRSNDASLADVMRWAPDIGWLLVAIAVGTLALAAARIRITFHRPRPDTTESLR